MLDRKTELPVLMIGSPKALASLGLHGTVKVTLQMLSTQQMCVCFRKQCATGGKPGENGVENGATIVLNPSWSRDFCVECCLSVS